MKTFTIMKSLTLFMLLLGTYGVEAQVAINHDGSDPASNTILHLKGSAEIPVVVTDDKARIGVGTTAPQRAIDIYRNSTDGNDGYIGLHIFRDNAYGGGMHVFHARGTQEAPEALRYGDLMGYFAFLGYDGSVFRQGGNFRFSVDGEPAEGKMPARFQLDLADTAGTSKTRMVVRATGRVGIGNSSPIAKLHVQETFTKNNAQRGIYNYVIAHPPATADRASYTVAENSMFLANEENTVSMIRAAVNGLNLHGTGRINNVYTQYNTAHLYDSRTAGNFNSVVNVLYLQDNASADYARGISNSLTVKDQATGKNIYGQTNAINYYSDQTVENTRISNLYNTINIRGGGKIKQVNGTINSITHNNPDTIGAVYGIQNLVNNAEDAGHIGTIIISRNEMNNLSNASINNLWSNYARVTNRAGGTIKNVYLTDHGFVNQSDGEITGNLIAYRTAASNRDNGKINRYYGIYTTFGNNGSNAEVGSATGIYSQLRNYSSVKIKDFHGIDNHIVNDTDAGKITNSHLMYASFTNLSADTVTAVRGVDVYVQNRNEGYIDQVYAFRARMFKGDGEINRWYGLYVDPVRESGPQYYGIYLGIGNKAYFGDKVGIGKTNPARELDINGVMHLQKRNTEPENPTDGDIYMDDGTNTSDHKPKLRVYADGAWHELW